MSELPPEGDVSRFGALAGAISGKPIDVRAAPRGEPSSCDSLGVLLDASLSGPAMRDACVAQALLIAAGSLSGPQLLRLIGRQRVARRYMGLELARARHAFAERLPHCVEATWTWLDGASLTPDAVSSLAIALDARRPAPEPPPHLGTLRPARLTLARSPSGAISADDGARRGAIAQLREDDELDDSASRLLRVLSTPLSGSALSDWVAKLLGFGRAPGGGGQPESDGGGAVALAGSERSTAAPSTSAKLSAEASAPELRLVARPELFRYPEWHHREQRYRMSWAHVRELRPHEAHPASPTPSRLSGARVRAELARIGLELERHRAQPDGEELDLDRLVRSRSERQADARIYVAARRTRRDLALLVLLDISQSTAERSANGRSIFHQQRELAREIVRASDRLGDRVALQAFHSWGRHLVQVQRVKGFEHRLDHRAHARLDALEPSGLTRMGAAIRHATHTLDGERKRAHRLMLLLTDGFAYDDDYAHAYAQADTQKALEEAAARGIGCVCLNIGSTQDDEVLRRLYGPAAYLRCADPERAVPALRRLLRSAMAHTAAGPRARARAR